MTTILAVKDEEYFYIAADSQSTGYNTPISMRSNKILRIGNLVITTCGDCSTTSVFKTILKELPENPNTYDLQKYIFENKDKLKPIFDDDRFSGSFFGLILSKNNNVIKAFEIFWESFNIEEWEVYELDRLLGFGSGSHYAMGAYKSLEKTSPHQSLQQRLISAITVAADLDLYTNKNINVKKFKLARSGSENK